MSDREAIVLNGSMVAMHCNNSLTIFESQQEYENSSVVPAKSMWMHKQDVVKLRDFLNKHYPAEGETK